MARRFSGRTTAFRKRPARLCAATCASRTPNSSCAKDSVAGIDSYSAFFENDRTTPTGLGGYLRERGFQRIFIAGLALDFCVRYSAEDAQAQGFTTNVVDDACRAIDVEGSVEAARGSFAERRIETRTTRSFA